MTTGLFSTRAHTGGRAFAAYRGSQAAERRQVVDHFAECLAEGGGVAACAAKLGKGASWGIAALKEIRAGLGEQAV